VPVGVGMPTVLVSGITVGGTKPAAGGGRPMALVAAGVRACFCYAEACWRHTVVTRLTIDVPDDLYQRLVERARRSNRSVRAEILDAIASTDQEEIGLPPSLEKELAAMAEANDERLWEIGRTRLPDEYIAEIEELREKSGAGGLTSAEEDRLAWLVQEADRVMLLRAEAAALLKQRGYDVEPLRRS
jgi:hypothetical protein